MKVEGIGILLLLLFISCNGYRQTHVKWWFATMRGQDVILEQIGGSFGAALKDHIKQPQFQLYKKGSEDLLKYVIETEWKFHRDDFIDPEMFHYENINLVLEGIDTTGTVQWNHQQIGTVNSMFFPHIFSIRKLFYEEFNYLTIAIPPAAKEAKWKYGNLSEPIKLYPECPPSSYHGDCYAFMLRKMQSSFGSSFGPRLASVGITRPAYVEGYNETSFRDISVNIHEEKNNWSVNISIYFANNTRNFINGTVEIKILDIHTTDSALIKANEDDEFVFRKCINIPKDKIELWWPIGFGKQVLYDLAIQFSSGKGEVINQSLRVGFRKVELIQERIGNGTSFYFKVNEKPIFMKGAVLAPLDLKPETAQNVKLIKKWFTLAVKHNMNMIRVWGGGMYQSPEFYKLADEMGLLIWQDFMFTDLSYPTDTKNLKNVKKEIRYQVRRLKNHPSIIIFCGNDEGEIALSENRYNQNRSKTVKQDYLKLFDQTVKEEFSKETNGNSIFVSSTPSNGKLFGGKISSNPNDALFGDMHIFDTMNDPFDHSTFPIPRFVSAYGLQSIPKIESFLKDTNNYSDIDFDQDFLRNRQHLPNGYGILKTVIGHQKQLSSTNDKMRFAKSFSYYSQVIQAYAMRIQTEKYRSYRSIITKDGFGNTMGVLYWHFNDVWTAPTWSGIDYFGEWKMMQYYVPYFFSPMIVTGQLCNENHTTKLDIFVVSDIEKIENANVHIQLGKWSGLGIFTDISVPVTVAAGSSMLVYTIPDLTNFLSNRTCTREECFVYLTMEKEGQLIAPENFILLRQLKNSNFGQPSIKVHLRKLPYQQIYEINLTSDTNALFVWLDAHEIDGLFSENGFLLVTPAKKVFFYSKINTSEEELRKILTVIHINDKRLI